MKKSSDDKKESKAMKKMAKDEAKEMGMLKKLVKSDKKVHKEMGKRKKK